MENEKLIELVRKSKHNHEIIDKYFNPRRECFGCQPIADFTLKDACAARRIDLNTVLSQLK